ncbi:DUF7344 domain-containing protein [Halorubrum sp. DTA46]|uniref:DUF7344 domain-containing protein n=1 Tax=Halorubrum sp. DTA46 TaxID=3402162 RepID=UPI003AAA4B4F
MEEITKDEVFEVLSSSRRRLILYHLHRRGGQAELRDLARDTAEAESDGDVDDGVVKRFYISLYQTHIPKLEEVGLVRYDSDSKTVSLTEKVGDVERVLDTESKGGRRWPVYYGALALFGSALAAVQLFGGAPPETSLLFAAALLLLAGYQYYETEMKAREYHFLERLISD